MPDDGEYSLAQLTTVTKAATASLRFFRALAQWNAAILRDAVETVPLGEMARAQVVGCVSLV